jgi:hypothetical protein
VGSNQNTFSPKDLLDQPQPCLLDFQAQRGLTIKTSVELCYIGFVAAVPAFSGDSKSFSQSGWLLLHAKHVLYRQNLKVK